MGQAVELKLNSIGIHDHGAPMLPRNTVSEAGGSSYSVPCSALSDARGWRAVRIRVTFLALRMPLVLLLAKRNHCQLARE